MIILDLGNGGVLHNDNEAIKKTIDSIAEIDTERKCILKFQLFISIQDKVQLRRDVFHRAYEYATELGFKCTSSAFDYDSVKFLSQYDVPFVKISNHPHLKQEKYYYDKYGSKSIWKSFILYCAKEFPLDTVLLSVADREEFLRFSRRAVLLCCVSDYPATRADYERLFSSHQLQTGISDHTEGLELYKEYKPRIWEKHYVLDEVTDKPRPYCMGPEELEEVLGGRE